MIFVYVVCDIGVSFSCGSHVPAPFTEKNCYLFLLCSGFFGGDGGSGGEGA